MVFDDKLISIGRGRFSSAGVIGDTAYFVLKSDGKLVRKSYNLATGQVYGSRLIGYCDDAWILPTGRLERLGEELYYANENP